MPVTARDFLFVLFGGQSWQDSGVTPFWTQESLLTPYGCQGLNLGHPCTRQTPYMLYHFSSPWKGTFLNACVCVPVRISLVLLDREFMSK